MTTEFKLPELGENIEAADVIAVLVKVGDTIEKDQSVIEIETDKATVEVPSNATGKITEVLVKEGDSVKVNQVILKIDETEGQKTEVEVVEKENKTIIPEETIVEEKVKIGKGKNEIVEFKLPELGENIESADVINVLVKPGDLVQIDQGIIEIETDKATVEVPSSVEGEITEVLVKVNETANVGDVLIKVKTTTSPVSKIEEVIPESDTVEIEMVEKNKATPKGVVDKLKPGEVDSQPKVIKGAAPAAPSVRRIAREIGVDINEVTGTDPGGRISMDDVKAHSKKLHQEKKTGNVFGVKKEALPDFSKYGKVEKTEMTKIRKVTAEHLSYAWTTIPHVTQHDKADITQLEKSRKQYNPEVEKAGGKLTITSILLKIIIAALKEFPQFNSSIDMDSKEIIYKKYFNIGVAVDTEHGLMVPVLKDVDKKNLIELSVEMGELAKKAREKKVSIEDLQGGCFTITNLGGIGGTLFTPVVNTPEVAILGVSRGSYEPILNDKGEFEPKMMLPLSLSYDHRIIDGADAARFIRFVVEALEQPLKIL